MTDRPFSGQVAVITGAGAGMGRSHARLLGRLGAAVVVNDISDSAQGVVEEIRAGGGTAELSRHDASRVDQAREMIAVAVERLGGLHIVVCNAGIIRKTPFEDLTSAEFDEVMRVNAYGAFNTLSASWPILSKQRYGRIVVVSSPSVFVPSPAISHYAASKGACLGLAMSLAAEGEDFGITVNALAPGAFTAMSAAGNAMDAEQRTWSEKTLSPDFVAPVVAWLVHPETTVTGRMIEAAAGRAATNFIASTRGMWKPRLEVDDLLANVDAVLDRSDFAVIRTLAEMKTWMTTDTTGWRVGFGDDTA